MGSRGSGSGRGGGIKMLQGEVAKASDGVLVQAFDLYANADLRGLNDAEKALRATTLDEGVKRGLFVEDRATGAYRKNSTGKPVVLVNDRQYRVDHVDVLPSGTSYARLSVLHNGRWVKLDRANPNLERRAAEVAKSQQRRR